MFYLPFAHSPRFLFFLFITFYVAYVICDLFQLVVLLYYSPNKLQDLKLGLATPVMPLYYAMQKCVTCWAITEELLHRRSFKDNFVPKRVREATWHW